MLWQRVMPAVWWPAAGRFVVADRHLPNGTRQHMVEGRVAPGTVIANAQVVGWDDMPNVQFARSLSHLSNRGSA
jgi:hypothetical protein